MGKSKFNVGDRVLCTDNGKYGNIKTIDDTDDYGYILYGVLFDDGEAMWLSDKYLELIDVDKKTAFLTELKELMERHEVSSIGDWEDEDAEWEPKEIRFNDGSKIQYTSSCITPSNLFDYDK